MDKFLDQLHEQICKFTARDITYYDLYSKNNNHLVKIITTDKPILINDPNYTVMIRKERRGCFGYGLLLSVNLNG